MLFVVLMYSMFSVFFVNTALIELVASGQLGIKRNFVTHNGEVMMQFRFHAVGSEWDGRGEGVDVMQVHICWDEGAGCTAIFVWVRVVWYVCWSTRTRG